MAYMCNAVLRANNSVLNVLAKLDEVIFREVVSAYTNSETCLYVIISNKQVLKLLITINLLLFKYAYSI